MRMAKNGYMIATGACIYSVHLHTWWVHSVHPYTCVGCVQYIYTHVVGVSSTFTHMWWVCPVHPHTCWVCPVHLHTCGGCVLYLGIQCSGGVNAVMHIITAFYNIIHLLNDTNNTYFLRDIPNRVLPKSRCT